MKPVIRQDMLHLESKFKLILVACLLGVSVHAQEAIFNTPFFLTRSMTNSSYAGLNDVEGRYFTALYKSQWSGIEGAPTTSYAGLDIPLNEKNGNHTTYGIGVISNSYATYSYTTLVVPISYQLKMGNGDQSLRFGLAPKFVNNAIDLSKAIAINPGDPTLQVLEPSYTYLDANFGVSYVPLDNMSFGIAADNFITNVFADNAGRINYSNYSQTSLVADFRFASDQSVIERNGFGIFLDMSYRVFQNTGSYFSGFLRLGDHKSNIGFGTQSNGVTMILIQASIGNTSLVYNFEYSTNELQSHTLGGHFFGIKRQF